MEFKHRFLRWLSARSLTCSNCDPGGSLMAGMLFSGRWFMALMFSRHAHRVHEHPVSITGGFGSGLNIWPFMTGDFGSG